VISRTWTDERSLKRKTIGWIILKFLRESRGRASGNHGGNRLFYMFPYKLALVCKGRMGECTKSGNQQISTMTRLRMRTTYITSAWRLSNLLIVCQSNTADWQKGWSAIHSELIAFSLLEISWLSFSFGLLLCWETNGHHCHSRETKRKGSTK
jgi:hypothetical protein